MNLNQVAETEGLGLRMCWSMSWGLGWYFCTKKNWQRVAKH